MKNEITILQAMGDSALFGKIFKRRWLRGDSWRNWRVFLAALFGLGLDAEGRAIYKQFTGRDDVPTQQASESWVVAGRRSGKSFIAALIAVFLASLRDYSSCLAPGETATIMVIAADRKQARVVLGYIFGFFDTIEILGRMVVNRTKESITLVNRVRIEVHTGSFKAVRGYSIACAILDECAFYDNSESANPAEELVTALRPAMATIPNSLLLGISSPYARRGVLFESHKENYGKAGASALVWKADTRSMNPSVSRLVIQAAYLRDAAAARAEYGGEFREDIASFISREVVEARVVSGRYELLRETGSNYVGFVDPSGGSSDSFTLAIAHNYQGTAVLDCVREVVPPFSPENVVMEFAQVLRSYDIGTVTGDAYGGLWPRERFVKAGIQYELSEKTRSELYLAFLPMLMSGTVELLDNPRLVAQLISLERRVARSGKDSVDHPPSGHDDIANACAGALVQALGGAGELSWVAYLKNLAGGVYPDPTEQPTQSSDPFGRQAMRQFEMKLAGVKPPGVPEESVSPCPRCQAARTFINGCGYRCQNCGAIYARPTDREPTSAPASEGACCSSPLPQRIPGGWRCAQCGRQSNLNNQPTNGVHRSQLETYSGGRANFQPKGFVMALGRFFGKR